MIEYGRNPFEGKTYITIADHALASCTNNNQINSLIRNAIIVLVERIVQEKSEFILLAVDEYLHSNDFKIVIRQVIRENFDSLIDSTVKDMFKRDNG